MGSVFRRGGVLWLKYKDASGKWTNASTGYAVGAEKAARKLLKEVETRIDAGLMYGPGPLTVERYSEHWLKDRESRGLLSLQDDRNRLHKHILPRLGKLELADVRPRHVRNLIRELRRSTLAPRTVRHIYATFRKMCNDAVVDEVIDATPCVLKRGDLPKNTDKDPAWRATAVFTRDEVEILISDERIPQHRRVYYALLVLGGPRVSGTLARRWCNYDPTTKPLGQLAVISKFSTKRKKEEAGTKTDVARYVPVHPTLAAVLAAWRMGGWAEFVGRHPGPDDLIIPRRDGTFWDGSMAHRALRDDLRMLGLRHRRTHDLRRSLISLARADGARKDIFRWITHGPGRDIIDEYTSLPWETLCAEMMKVNVQLRTGQLVAFPAVTTAAGGDLVQSVVQTRRVGN